ncbi:hypothetical protein Bhyg_13103, partial [Pseudolycoriella hygida]
MPNSEGNNTTMNATLAAAVAVTNLVPQFDPAKDNWHHWLELLEVHFEEIECTEEKTRRSTLLKAIGTVAYDVIRSLTDPKLPKELGYKKLVELLEKHYAPTVMVYRERKSFFSSEKRRERIHSGVACSCKKVGYHFGISRNEEHPSESVDDYAIYMLESHKLDSELDYNSVLSEDVKLGYGVYVLAVEFKGGCKLDMVCDTGAPLNLISYKMYRKLFPFTALRKCDLPFTAYGGQRIQREFSDVLDGKLGGYTVSKVHLSINKEAIPIFHKPRPVPLAWRSKIENQLDMLVKTGVLEPVDDSDWACPILDFKHIAKETRRDPILSRLSASILSGMVKTMKGVEFEPFKAKDWELSVESECVLWGYRTVVPSKLLVYFLWEMRFSSSESEEDESDNLGP